MAMTVYIMQICELELTASETMQPHVYYFADTHTPYCLGDLVKS